VHNDGLVKPLMCLLAVAISSVSVDARAQVTEGVAAPARGAPWPKLPADERAEHLCLVSPRPLAGEGGVTLHGLCWGTGLLLGEADRYNSSVNLRLKATVVTLERHGSTRVLLLRADPNDKPLVEDITGSLASGAGRAPWSKIDDLGVDLVNFAQNGRIGLRRGGAESGSITANLSDSFEFDVGAHVAAENRRATIVPASDR
ncbi:MAG: hypothetical protein WA842_03955, partial [Croceibacterium sp.]